MDAAILFSDILTVPYALGQEVRFVEGRGPVLGPLDLAALQPVGSRLDPVYETVGLVRASLPEETALIGFAGAPWTVAAYMVEGGSSRDWPEVRRLALGDPGRFAELVDLLVEVTADHLAAQADAGAEALQLFDSWAGLLPPAGIRRWCLEPARRIATALRERHPAVPLILFPRGAGALAAEFAGIGDCVGLDTVADPAWAAGAVQGEAAVQGNLDPMLLVVGGAVMERAAREILSALRPRPACFQSRPRCAADNAAGACRRPWPDRARGAVSRLAVVLFNLGGPDSPEAVKPFLRNLFADPAILPAPAPVRFMLSRYIAGRRAALARAAYEQLGGASPLLEQTQALARALEAALAARGEEARCFVAMRYWHPRAAAALPAVRNYGPDEIVALPLYPQFSTTTSGSSLAEWRKLAGEDSRLRVLCCHPQLEGLVEAWAGPLAEAVRRAHTYAPVRVLFTAHGLPERVIAGGDPYAWQVERTADALRAAVEARLGALDGVDWRVTWQSRATPEKWLEPDTGAEVEAAAEGGAGAGAGADCVSCPSIPKRWSSSTSNTGPWRSAPVRPPGSGWRRRAPRPPTSKGWRTWCWTGGRNPASAPPPAPAARSRRHELALRALPLDQGAAYRVGRLLDGRHALPAAPLHLPSGDRAGRG